MDVGHTTSLMDRLHADELPEPELRLLISQYFGHGSLSRAREVDYSTEQGGPVCVTMKYDRRGPLVDVQRGSGLVETSLDQLADQIAHELQVTGRSVQKTIMFAAVPTVGHWRYQEDVAITEPPAVAPRPREVRGEHPLVIEVSYPNADNFSLRNMRARRLTRQWELLLCVLIGWGIHAAPRYTTKRWMLVVTQEDPLELESRFLQEGYTAPGLDPSPNRFSTPDGAPVALIDNVTFFARQGISAESRLSVPAFLNEALDRFEAMPLVVQERFLRACYWFQLSELEWGLSHSASYVSLVQSVECLLDTEAKARCPGCDRLLQGPTQAFGRFLDAYARGTTKAERDTFYGLRSSLTHGGHLLESDLEVGFGGLQPLMWEQHEVHQQMNRVARLTLINWLLSS